MTGAEGSDLDSLPPSLPPYTPSMFHWHRYPMNERPAEMRCSRTPEVEPWHGGRHGNFVDGMLPLSEGWSRGTGS